MRGKAAFLFSLPLLRHRGGVGPERSARRGTPLHRHGRPPSPNAGGFGTEGL